MEKVPANTLLKIEEDIKKNDLGKARDRLHGLIATYPDELELRRKLGDIYYELKYPSMAGRYWYLEKNKTPEMQHACIEFEKSMGNNPFQIVRALKFKGDKEILKNLEFSDNFSPVQKKVTEKLLEEPEDSVIDKLLVVGCLSVIFGTIVFAFIGVYSFVKWIL
ncbi:DNA helicase [Peribacillus frigoritolerans]|nr:DNA helicase [Peribacillus frigoritolerans]